MFISVQLQLAIRCHVRQLGFRYFANCTIVNLIQLNHVYLTVFTNIRLIITRSVCWTGYSWS